MRASHPVITLTTDFGTRDPYVGMMKGVILGISPAVSIVDVSHEVGPQAIAQGAFIIGNSYRFFPRGTIHVVVIDPGVGTSRKAILVSTPTARFLAPDNGVLTHVVRAGYAEGHLFTYDKEDLPPEYEAYELSNRKLWLESVSQTFHGRDILAPVAAHLSLGLSDWEVGPRLSRITLLPQGAPSWDGPVLEGRVVHVDRYGNLISNISLDDGGAGGVVVEMEGLRVEGLSRSYEEADGVLAIVGSHGTVEIAVRGGSAARQFGAGVGARVRVCYHKPVNSNAPAGPPDPEPS